MAILFTAIILHINTKPVYKYYIDQLLSQVQYSSYQTADSLYNTYNLAKSLLAKGNYENAIYNFYIVTLSDSEREFVDSALYYISLIQDKINLPDEAMDSRKYFLQRYKKSALSGKISFLYALNLRDLTKNFDEAIKFLHRAEKSGDPDILPFTYFELGLTYFMKRNFDKAYKFLQYASRFAFDEPVQSYLTCVKGYIYVEIGKIKEAKDILGFCSSPYLKNYTDLYRAKLFIQLGLPDSAETLLSAILKRENVETDVLGSAYYLMGEISFINGKYKKSMEYYEKALQHVTYDIDPDKLRYKIELCKYRLGYYKSATELNINFVNKYPDSPLAPELLYEVFFLYTVRHWFKSALKILQWLAVRYDGNAYTIQAVSEGLKRGIPAKDIYKIVIPHIKKSYLQKTPSANLVIAVLYDSLGMPDSALAIYSRIIKTGSKSLKYQAMLQSMRIYMKIKRYNEAIAVGEQLYSLASQQDSKFYILEKLQEAYINSGQIKDLENFLLSVVEDFSGDYRARIYIKLSELRNEVGDRYMAKFYLKKAFESAESDSLKKKISLLLATQR